jgi:CNP1-like family
MTHPCLVQGALLLYTPRPMLGTHWFSALWNGGGKPSIGRVLLFLALVLTAHPLRADQDNYGDQVDNMHFDEKYVKKWKESKVTIPSYPNDRDLLPVPMGATDTLKIFVDDKSISRAPDLVVRFSLVVQSPSGARSVFYEGLRCETRQYKTYAIGTDNHRFVPVNSPRWRTIPRAEMNAFRDNLYRNYICDGHATARAPEEIVRLLKYPS